MKRNRMLKNFAALLITVVMVSGIIEMPVSAGLRELVYDASTVQEEIDESVWHNAGGDVTCQSGVISFPTDSTANTKLVAKTKIKQNDGIDEMLKAKATLKFGQLQKGEKFVIAMGLKTLESELGEEGNLEIAFVNENGLQVSVTAFTEEGEEVEVMATKKCGSLSKTDVKLSLTAEQKFILQIGNTRVCDTTLPINGEGRFGFLQTGGCAVKISNIEITAYDYERPENCDIYEDFEDGEFNKNLLTSKLVMRNYNDYDSFIGIGDYQGNKVFYFTYNACSYLGTRYNYSNFEMSFDVPYLQRSDEYDDDGNLLNAMSPQIVVAFGGEAATFNDYGHETAAERILFRTTSDIVTKQHSTPYSVADKIPFFDSEHNKGFSIKIRMEDNLVTIFMKWMDETEWIDVMSYHLQTPTGTIQIWGQDYSNWAIDNLKIVNLDANPNLIEVDYASSVVEVPEDYVYEPMEKVYVQSKQTQEGTFSWYVLIPVVAAVCILVLSSALIVQKVKRRKEMGAVKDEK